MSQKAVAFDHSLVTSAFELPGLSIVRNYGLVRGIIVRSRSVVGNIGAAFQQIVGGNISIYTELCERARMDAYELMIQHAAEIGANGVIGVRYDATEIAQGVSGSTLLWHRRHRRAATALTLPGGTCRLRLLSFSSIRKERSFVLFPRTSRVSCEAHLRGKAAEARS